MRTVFRSLSVSHDGKANHKLLRFAVTVWFISTLHFENWNGTGIAPNVYLVEMRHNPTLLGIASAEKPYIVGEKSWGALPASGCQSNNLYSSRQSRIMHLVLWRQSSGSSKRYGRTREKAEAFPKTSRLDAAGTC